MADDILPSPPIEAPRVNEKRGPILADSELSPDTHFAFSPARLYHLLESRSTGYLEQLGGIRGIAIGVRSDVESGLGADEDELDGVVTAKAALAAARTGEAPKIEPLAAAHAHTKPRLRHHEDGFRDRKHTYGTNRLPKPHRKSFLQLAWMAFNDKLIFLLTASATISLALGIYEAVVGDDEGGSSLEWIESVTIICAIVVIVLVSSLNDLHKNRCFEKLNQKNQERWVTVTRSGKNQTISIFDILVGDLLHLEAGDIVPVDGLLCTGSGVQCDESSITGEVELVHKTPGTKGLTDRDDPFIFSGTRVVQGVGSLLVTSVGSNSLHGRMQMSLRAEVSETPLQKKLGRLAKHIIIAGFCVGTVFFLIIFIRWAVRLPDVDMTPEDTGESFLDIFMLAVTVVLIGVPEGLSLAVAVALAFATTRMLRDKNLVRLLRSCEIMGNATTICSDKTGTLTQNQMSVVKSAIGASGLESEVDCAGLHDDAKALLRASFALNSTAFESEGEYVGSSTETALLRFSRDSLGMGPLAEERHNGHVVELFPFSPQRKWMAAVVRQGEKYVMLVKGAAEIVVRNCSQVLQDATQGLEGTELDSRGWSRTTQSYASDMLRPVAVAYRELDGWAPNSSFEEQVGQLTLVGIFGIRDPLRPEVVGAVQACQAAGVFVRMVTGDNVVTAKAIATECGIYTPGGIAMDGPTFRRLTEEQMDQVVPRLQVLARSSPEDKQILVRHLKKQGETVAVTGDGTNDAFALKAADIGFAMGVSGTDIAKEACAIVLMDDNFASIVKALAWGRAINDAAKKFIQFQFTINATAATITIVSTLVHDIDSAVFAVIQLLWLNLIMDIFAALALATDYPTQTQMERRPEPRNAPIVNARMWKMILGQAVYQLVVIFTLHYAGGRFFPSHSEQLQTLVFNVYMFMQVFNQLNCRRVDNRFNIFEGIHRNPWFLGVQVITIGGQAAIIMAGGNAFQTQPLTGLHWGWCIFFGFLTLPIGMLIRLLPDEYVVIAGRKLKPLAWPVAKATAWFRSRKAAKLLPRQDTTDSEEPDEERKIRRFQFTWLKRRTPKARRVPREEAVASEPARVGEALDLVQMVEDFRSRPGGQQAGFEIHPQTSKDDPILFQGESKVPPSQNPEMLRYLGL
ncbi:hypothetical protein B0I35DRAFT_357918 [Stachybotrys elegans]|uniref:Calcium-transporting ATPase n=1 Tax=Stachybotrys elegans TaxID=80388 RepID=A0A8K0WNJ5_9HYPO|nr:hypothetical protein B0I35DRAFT_357918 [Stachybotrys elegans]